MGSKQEELEAIVQQEGFDVVTITEMWWDGGMIVIIMGVLQWLDISSLEETDKAGEVVG